MPGADAVHRFRSRADGFRQMLAAGGVAGPAADRAVGAAGGGWLRPVQPVVRMRVQKATPSPMPGSSEKSILRNFVIRLTPIVSRRNVFSHAVQRQRCPADRPFDLPSAAVVCDPWSQRPYVSREFAVRPVPGDSPLFAQRPR